MPASGSDGGVASPSYRRAGTKPPLRDWHRHHPTARRVAAAIVDNAPVLALPRWRVIHDTRRRFGCSDFIARQAYAIARKAVAA